MRERELEQRVGTAAGWLNAGRPRREAGRIAFRIALRGRLLALGDATLRFADRADRAGAARERDTPMPDYTYLQAAQPTTAGHWLLSFALPRAARRASGSRPTSPRPTAARPAAGGVNGSRFPLDRERLADRLGFDAPIEHTRDAMWQTDGLTETVWHAATAATNASRFAEDLELYGSDEFGLLRIGDELCRASALMPQKRNPYALVVIRGAAGTLLGRATGVLATQRTPSGRTDNLLYAYGEVAGAVELATRSSTSPRPSRRACASTARPARARCASSHALAADVAEVLCLEHGLDYRSAYRVVGRAVGESDLTARARRRRTRTPGPRARVGDELVGGAGPGRALATRTVDRRRRARADGRDARARARRTVRDAERRRGARRTRWRRPTRELLQRAAG